MQILIYHKVLETQMQQKNQRKMNVQERFFEKGETEYKQKTVETPSQPLQPSRKPMVENFVNIRISKKGYKRLNNK